ncbi:MAG: hypothetical protein JWO51_2444 [Rhodospirillales bacterium]|nr:hypothetical protein [Rhodospirillales bacterium]
MDQNVTVIIGGETIAVPPMCFAALKRAWPAIQAMPGQTNLVDQTARSIEIVAAALAQSRPELTAAAIEERLKGSELIGLVTQVPQLLDESGLMPAEKPAAGELPAGS